jgi:translation initiation factor 1 (eIF-1/SUI1)
MGKRVTKIEQVNKSTGDVELEKIRHVLAKKYACYVLITCTKPTREGQMDVEMNYEGDIDLAAMLTDDASHVFNEKRSHRESL